MSARALVGSRKLEHAPPILKNLNWVTLEKKRKLHELVMFQKIYSGKGTADQTRSLEKYRREQNINTRGAGTTSLSTPSFNTNYMKDSFYIRNIKQWKNLPDKIRSTPSTNAFKARLHEHLFKELT